MSAADLGLSLAELPRAVVGLAAFLLPGIAAADRLGPAGRLRFLLAPVFSFTLLPVGAILLHFAAGWQATPASTALLALALAALLGARRIQAAFRLGGDATPPAPAPPPGRRAWLELSAALAVALLVALVHGLPHLPGTGAPADLPPVDLAGRAADLAAGRTYPYPVHVDEHTHLANAAEVVRNGTAADPYTKERFDVGLFSLQGDVHERGFQMGLAQLSLLTGAGLSVLFLWGPAAWAAFLALLAWALARPHPGALAGAALLAALPTTTLFLGASFLVPIAFGLAWVLAVVWMMVRGRGASRVAAVLLLSTGAFFIHLVAGAACLAASATAALVQEGPWRHRLGLAGVALLPLAWVGPAVADEVVRELGSVPDYPLGGSLFASFGWLGWGLFVAGAALALAAHRSPPHRALAAFAVVVAACVAGSLLSGHNSLALYYRSTHLLFLAAALLAGHAIGAGAAALARLRVPGWARSVAAVAAAAIVLVQPVAAHLDTPYYRVHDAASWEAGRALEDAGAQPGDVFLSEPWRAMAYSAMTGATPYTVLRPGGPPARGADWDFYLTSGGASSAWLQDRGIDWVVAPIPPKANHTVIAPGVYRIG